MSTLVVTSLTAGAGKTTICAGIGKQFQNTGKKVGYLRAVAGSTEPDADALFMKEALGLKENEKELAPPFTSDNQMAEAIRAAVDGISSEKDVVLVECAVEVVLSVAKALSAKILVVATFSEIERAAHDCRSLGAGVVINKVPVSQLGTVESKDASAFKDAGITILGVLPESRELLTFTVNELASLVDGKVMNDPENATMTADNFMLGAMTVDSALPYYSRIPDKVVVTRAERPDMQLAALETSTRALVLAGKTEVYPQIQLKAESKKIPVVVTELDVKSVAARLEDAVVRMRFGQISKLPALLKLMEVGVDAEAVTRFTTLP